MMTFRDDIECPLCGTKTHVEIALLSNLNKVNLTGLIVACPTCDADIMCFDQEDKSDDIQQCNKNV